LLLDKVLFIPSGRPPHKAGLNVTQEEHRYNMICEALHGNPGFEASKIEIDRAGNTYTIDTLRKLHEIYGNDTDFFFITGADVILEITTWKDFKEVLKLCEFVAAFRPNYDKEKFLKEIKKLKSDYNARIHVIDVPLIDISSTEIRERISEGKSIKYLVPERVEDYIIKNKLFK